MENTQTELARVQEAVEQSELKQIDELAALRLAAVGAGGGEVVFA
jgi:hypothetical protein